MAVSAMLGTFASLPEIAAAEMRIVFHVPDYGFDRRAAPELALDALKAPPFWPEKKALRGLFVA